MLIGRGDRAVLEFALLLEAVGAAALDQTVAAVDDAVAALSEAAVAAFDFKVSAAAGDFIELFRAEIVG
jgi:hypothetical protein